MASGRVGPSDCFLIQVSSLASCFGCKRTITGCQWVVGLSFVGRAPTARPKADKVRALCDAGVRPAEIATQVGISRTSVYRVLTA